MSYKALSLIIASFFYNDRILAYPQITLFLREYPELTNHTTQKNSPDSVDESAEQHRQHIHCTSNRAKQLFYRPALPVPNQLNTILEHKRHTAGIFMTYAGMLHASDWNGAVSFTRGQEKETLYLIVTPRITPILMNQATIHHWEIDPNITTAVFKVSRHKDSESEAFYWLTESVEKLPSGNIVPLESIVIFAKPEYIYIPTGITLTQKTSNFVLPDIYVKQGARVYGITLYVLTIKHFFKSAYGLEQHTPTSYTTLLDPFNY